MPPPSIHQLSRPSVESAPVYMRVVPKGERPSEGYGATGDKIFGRGNVRPLSPGSNYPTTKNIQVTHKQPPIESCAPRLECCLPPPQIQRNGFGTWIQNFIVPSKGTKYGVPVFLKNGAINPAFLAVSIHLSWHRLFAL